MPVEWGTVMTHADSPSTGVPGFAVAANGWDVHRAVMGLTDNQLRSLSPLALAYIGDAVYELFIRGRYLLPPKRLQTYHHQVVEQVRAEQQARYLDVLLPHLTHEELDVVRRGRNATGNRKQRANLRDYQRSTALEALVGYLYLTNSDRLTEVLGYLPLPPQP